MSEWVRSLLANACAEDELASRLNTSIERISRQSVFLMVGIDALLAGHPDHALRERAHQAYARKCRELGLAPTRGEGGDA
jgi:LmbE family N-acetylglucosaminyl deacetylase